MKKLGGILKGVAGVLLLAGLAVVLSLTFQRPLGEEPANLPTVSRPAVQEEPVATMVAQSPLSTPTDEPTPILPPTPTPTEDTTFRSPLPTPTEKPTPMPPPTPTPIGPVPLPPETPPVPGKAATLWNGNIWLVEHGHEPEALTDFGDVSAIFGWNRDGTMILFGRGRIVQAEFVGDTTELWLLDVSTRQTRQLTTSSMVKTASWAPVDDRIAYCELGDVLTVITLDGEKLHQLKSAGCSFTWSPDGSAIAVETYTPDMIADDGLKFSVLAIWWLEDDSLQVFSDAKDESHFWPVWSIDGQRILFHRACYEPSKQGLSGLHVVDAASGRMQRLEGTSISTEEISRSPRADRVAYRVDPDIFVMDFEGRFEVVGQGRSLMWLPDGRTLLYRAGDGSFQVVTVDLEVVKTAVGGLRPSPGLYIQPEYFFAPGG